MTQLFFRKILLGIFCLGYFSVCIAQQKKQLTGKVVDGYKHQALVSALVNLQNTSYTQITNPLGEFIFETIPVGNYFLKIEYAGYQSQLLPIKIDHNQTLDVGTIILIESIESEQKNQLIALSDDELQDENQSGGSVVFLQANKDAFQKAAAFNFSPYRFRVRGLDNAYSPILINGLVMNKFQDGRPQWNNWGGLNDVTRNPEFTIGTTASDNTFGGLLGSQNFTTRASGYKPVSRISMGGSNTHYNYRIMATHASGISKKGWSYVISASKRWADEAYFEGTTYNANAVFVAVEKKLNDTHSLNFTGIFAQNSRGKNSSNTTEITQLAGTNYNSFWGYQEGKKRNSRVKNTEEPIFMLSHYWKINAKNTLQTNASYQFGSQSNSRLDFSKANNPDPSYYKNLPSYYLTAFDANHNATPDYEKAADATAYFNSHKQIDWAEMYQANQRNTTQGSSVYVLFADANADRLWSANSMLFSEITPNITFQAGITIRSLTSENYRKLLDALGGSYFIDTDSFLFGNQAQANLLTPNRKVVEGNRFRYNYTLRAKTIDAFSQLRFAYQKTELYWAQMGNYTQYEREGMYQNGLYPNSSLGKSETIHFENLGTKMGALYKYNGFHFFEVNAAIFSKAPTIQSTFSNARLNNKVVADIKNEWLTSLDASYYYRSTRLKGRVTAYYSSIKNSTSVAYYYTEGLGVLNQEDALSNSANAFVSEISTGIGKTNLGTEISLEYKINSVLQASVAANIGQYIYDENPNLVLNIDNQQTEIDLGKSYLKNYKQPGMPQRAYSIGLEYKNPAYWWAAINANYLTHNYVAISPLLRTDNFFINPEDNNGFPFKTADTATARTLLKQERLDDVFTLNLMGGKTWKIKKQTLGLFVSLNNILGNQFKIGGYEQARNANYQELLQDYSGGVRAFGPKYTYSYGRTFFINLYIHL